MIKLDDEFLESVGLSGLPVADRQSFLQSLYSELELRVGVALSEGLSERQLDEFESFIDRDPQSMIEWLELHRPNFPTDPIFIEMEAAESTVETVDLIGEYTSMAWLQENRPDYADIVTSQLEQIKKEVFDSRDKILHAVAPSLDLSSGVRPIEPRDANDPC